jgi:hypothetical protein
MVRVPVQHAALVARGVVGGAAQVVLAAGAVVGVAALLGRTGTLVCLAWIAVLAAVGWTAAVLRAACTGEREPDAVRDAAWCATALLVASTLAVTSPALYVQLLAVLGALTVTGLGLTARAQPQRPPVPGAAPVPPGPSRARTRA